MRRFPSLKAQSGFGVGGSRRAASNSVGALMALLITVVVVVTLLASTQRVSRLVAPSTLLTSAGAHDATVSSEPLAHRNDASSTSSPSQQLHHQPKETEPPGLTLDQQHTVAAVMASMLRGTRQLLREQLHAERRRHADANGIASVRGCFVSLIRHSDEGIKKFHRLLVNVRQKMPLMAGKYPFVAFHENAASSAEIARVLLSSEVAFVEGRQSYGGSVASHHDEVMRAGEGEVQPASVNTGGGIASVRTLSEAVIAAFGHDDAMLRRLLRRFVFPKAVTHPSATVREAARVLWPHDAGDISGVELVKLSLEDFGHIPTHIKSGQWPYPQNSWWGVSYRHMCRFFGLRIFYTPFFRENHFDFYMRLDTDSHILSTPMSIARTPHNPDPMAESRRPATSVEEVDYFEVMAYGNHLGNDGSSLSAAEYMFSMFHPQTISQFMVDVFETYDEFQHSEQHENYVIGDRVVERHLGKIGRSTSRPLRGPLSELPFPRRDGVHYWDNFEVVNLNMFREIPKYDRQVSQWAERVLSERQTFRRRNEAGDAPIPWSTDERIGILPDKWSLRDFDCQTAPSEVEFSAIMAGVSNRSGELYTRSLAALLPGSYSNAEDKDMADALSITLARHSDAMFRSVKRHLVAVFDRHVSRHNERSRRVAAWFSLLEAKGGFYYHRWGDAEIRTLTMQLFVNATKILYAESLPYQHYFNFHCPRVESLLGGKPNEGAVGATQVRELQSYAEACETEARKGYGDGLKSRGSARMNPAEASHYNGAFEEARNRIPGGWRSV